MLINECSFLEYERDFKNQYDPYAILIKFKERSIGFVSREFTNKIATDIDLNETHFLTIFFI
ncbi:HIRAN domain-containing protein [Aquisalibacillus elongatus]|uniref:HIRAN domain-containing protein n=1 Tax=Aquisalibacillus elongatus TaxID=485577 RepID=UPI003CCC6F06